MNIARKLPTLLLLVLPLTCAAASLDPDNNTAPNSVPAGRQACGRQAGLSTSVLEQRREIISDARARIRAVEDNSTLNPRQQRQEIREIRMGRRAQVAKLIGPEQQQTLRQCRSDRARLHPTAQADANTASGSSSERTPQPK